jgi:hypothetical protein
MRLGEFSKLLERIQRPELANGTRVESNFRSICIAQTLEVHIGATIRATASAENDGSEETQSTHEDVFHNFSVLQLDAVELIGTRTWRTFTILQ